MSTVYYILQYKQCHVRVHILPQTSLRSNIVYYGDDVDVTVAYSVLYPFNLLCLMLLIVPHAQYLLLFLIEQFSNVYSQRKNTPTHSSSASCFKND